jgi:large subunit ribosomal protein L15
MSMIHEITSAAPAEQEIPAQGPRREQRSRENLRARDQGFRRARWRRSLDPGREGGQTPVFRRFPKRGFSNYQFERRFHIVNLADLDQFDAGATVDASALKEKGLVPDLKQPVKISAGGGKLSKKLTIVAGWYSKSAHAAITSAGGTAQNLKGEAVRVPQAQEEVRPARRGREKEEEGRGGSSRRRPGRRGSTRTRARRGEEGGSAPKTEGASE